MPTTQARRKLHKDSPQLEAFYRGQNPDVLAAKAQLVKTAGDELVTLYCQNVFPYMKMTWGTHPNHIGHMEYPGCFRCHDGNHRLKTAPIPQDCSTCHNLLAVQETKPKVLSDLGISVGREIGSLHRPSACALHP